MKLGRHIRRHTMAIARGSVLGTLTWLTGSPAYSCAVCGTGEDQSTQIFLYSTIALSLVPLALIGGLLYWLYKSTKHRAP